MQNGARQKSASAARRQQNGRASTAPRTSSAFVVLLILACICLGAFNVLHDSLLNDEGGKSWSKIAMQELKDTFVKKHSHGGENGIASPTLVGDKMRKKGSLVDASAATDVGNVVREASGDDEDADGLDDDGKGKAASSRKRTRRKDARRSKNKDVAAGGPLDGDTASTPLLSCSEHGGPSDEIAAEMVYWEDIPSDSKFVSPFMPNTKAGEPVKYMTFEPDGGGWNNIRMSMETVVAMAHAMGRTLVLPPEQRMYLLGKDRQKQKTHFSFKDFVHFDALDEQEGLDIISMEEFLKREGVTGGLVNVTSGKVNYPPDNRTDWHGGDIRGPLQLKEYLRSVAPMEIWRPHQCVAAIPNSAGPEGVASLKDLFLNITKGKGRPKKVSDKGEPLPVDSPPIDRMQELLAGRKELCIYDDIMQKSKVVHFMCYHKMRARLLTHFYTFLYFQNWKQDLWTKRFVRDHLRYTDNIMCTAARVVNAIRERARARNITGNPEGLFDSFHIRRGDFQYKNVKVEADVIYRNTKDLLQPGSTVYIATDERKQDFFKPLAEHYDICFLSDFKHVLEGMNTNYYGMIDQMVAARSRVFVGTYYSTFTGYINRVRGYYASRNKLEGYKDGIINSWHFMPLGHKSAMREYVPPSGNLWAREFPLAWRDIDRGIGELQVQNVNQALATGQ